MIIVMMINKDMNGNNSSKSPIKYVHKFMLEFEYVCLLCKEGFRLIHNIEIICRHNHIFALEKLHCSIENYL